MEAFSTKSKKPQPALSPKSRQKPKILAPNGCNIFSNALVARMVDAQEFKRLFAGH